MALDNCRDEISITKRRDSDDDFLKNKQQHLIIIEVELHLVIFDLTECQFYLFITHCISFHFIFCHIFKKASILLY